MVVIGIATGHPGVFIGSMQGGNCLTADCVVFSFANSQGWGDPSVKPLDKDKVKTIIHSVIFIPSLCAIGYNRPRFI